MRKKINPEETVSISFEFILTIQLSGASFCKAFHKKLLHFSPAAL